jgi:hypothetical protein
MRWLKRLVRQKPVLAVHVALEPTGKGASFVLFKTSGGWVWNWSTKELAASTPAVAARIEQECRYAMTAMEERLRLPLTYPDFAEIPEGMQRLPGWPWDAESDGPELPTMEPYSMDEAEARELLRSEVDRLRAMSYEELGRFATAEHFEVTGGPPERSTAWRSNPSGMRGNDEAAIGG